MLRRLTLLQVFLLMTSLLAGCTPAPQPVWLGDSSGFVTPCPDGSVVHYDLKKEATRRLAEAYEVCPVRAAVSPDGRLVAIAAAAWGPDSRAVAIRLVRLADGTLETSQMRQWGDSQAARAPQPTSAFWCPSGTRILITYAAGPKNLFGQSAVYDVDSNRLTEMAAPPPAVALTSALNVSPIPPDGSGYLAINPANDEAPLSFVDWKGWEYGIRLAPELADKLCVFGGPNGSDAEKKNAVFPLWQGQWVGRDLTCLTRHGLVRVSLEQKLALLEPVPADQQRLCSTISTYRPKDRSWFVYQVVPFREGPLAVLCEVRSEEASLRFRIRLIDSRDDRRRVLFEGAPSDRVLDCPLIPSPDGKFILVSLVQEGQGMIHVVRHDGTVVTQLETGRVRTGR